MQDVENLSWKISLEYCTFKENPSSALHTSPPPAVQMFAMRIKDGGRFCCIVNVLTTLQGKTFNSEAIGCCCYAIGMFNRDQIL